MKNQEKVTEKGKEKEIPNFFEQLPDEMFLHFVSFLPNKDLANLALVEQSFHSKLKDEMCKRKEKANEKISTAIIIRYKRFFEERNYFEDKKFDEELMSKKIKEDPISYADTITNLEQIDNIASKTGFIRRSPTFSFWAPTVGVGTISGGSFVLGTVASFYNSPMAEYCISLGFLFMCILFILLAIVLHALRSVTRVESKLTSTINEFAINDDIEAQDSTDALSDESNLSTSSAQINNIFPAFPEQAGDENEHTRLLLPQRTAMGYGR